MGTGFGHADFEVGQECMSDLYCEAPGMIPPLSFLSGSRSLLSC